MLADVMLRHLLEHLLTMDNDDDHSHSHSHSHSHGDSHSDSDMMIDRDTLGLIVLHIISSGTLFHSRRRPYNSLLRATRS